MSARKAIRYQCEHTVADPDPQIGEGGLVIQTQRKGGGAVSKKIFSALQASVWSKNKGGPDPPGPSPGSATDIDSLRLVVLDVGVAPYFIYFIGVSSSLFSLIDTTTCFYKNQ